MNRMGVRVLAVWGQSSKIKQVPKCIKFRDSRSSQRTCPQLQRSLCYSGHDPVTSLLEPHHPPVTLRRNEERWQDLAPPTSPPFTVSSLSHLQTSPGSSASRVFASLLGKFHYSGCPPGPGKFPNISMPPHPLNGLLSLSIT